MAASWQDHVNLKLTLPDAAESTGEWAVMAPNLRPTGLPAFSVIVAPRRALDGTLRAHVLKSAGSPILFVDYTPILKVDSYADLVTLSGFLGKVVYYVPSFHDALDHQAAAVQVLVERLGIPSSPGPLVPYMTLPIHLVDAEN
jgi:hypothetical protein